MLKRRLMRSVHAVQRAFWFVTRPRTCGGRAIAVTPEGRIILVRHSYVDGWYLPGGGRKPLEDPEAAMLRELREEIGLTAFDSIALIAEFDHQPDFKRDRLSLFLVTGVRHSPRPSLEIEAIADFDLLALPPEVTRASRRRIEEYAQGSPIAAQW